MQEGGTMLLPNPSLRRASGSYRYYGLPSVTTRCGATSITSMKNNADLLCGSH